MEKPVSVIRVELIDNITKLINDSKLPPYILVPIMEDFLVQAQTATKRQYEAELAMWTEYQKKEIPHES